VANIECPNFYQLGTKWVLITSPHRASDYFSGDFDPESGRFSVEKQGMVDHSDQFYAPNGLHDSKGRRIILGWIRGFPEGKGWNGCLSLPRVLTLGRENALQQQPAPELKQLRGPAKTFRNLAVDSVTPIAFQSGAFELELQLDLGTARRAGIRFGKSGVIAFDGSTLEVCGKRVPVDLPAGGLRLRAFIDRSVVEVFANHGEICVTKVTAYSESAPAMELFAESGEAHFRRIDVWPIKSIW
jgi:beta-fructofuranosidase